MWRKIGKTYSALVYYLFTFPLYTLYNWLVFFISLSRYSYLKTFGASEQGQEYYTVAIGLT